MKLDEIITISGHSGLFKQVAKGKNNLIVESLVDGKRTPIFSTEKAVTLADIALFTTGEEVSLSDVFKKIYKFQDKKEVILDFKKQQKEMLELFEKIVPEYDKNRVYASDIKKIFTWYNILLKNNLITIDEEIKEIKKEDDKAEQVEQETKESNIVETPSKKSTRKKKKSEE